MHCNKFFEFRQSHYELPLLLLCKCHTGENLFEQQFCMADWCMTRQPSSSISGNNGNSKSDTRSHACWTSSRSCEAIPPPSRHPQVMTDRQKGTFLLRFNLFEQWFCMAEWCMKWQPSSSISGYKCNSKSDIRSHACWTSSRSCEALPPPSRHPQVMTDRQKGAFALQFTTFVEKVWMFVWVDVLIGPFSVKNLIRMDTIR